MLEVTDTRSGRRLAAKKLPKFVHGRQASQQAAVVAAEAGTQAALGAVSPAVLRLVDVRQEDSYFYLISEVGAGFRTFGQRGRGWGFTGGWPCRQLAAPNRPFL